MFNLLMRWIRSGNFDCENIVREALPDPNVWFFVIVQKEGEGGRVEPVFNFVVVEDLVLFWKLFGNLAI